MIVNTTVTLSKQAEVHELAQQVSRNVYAADTATEAQQIIKDREPDMILFDRGFHPDVDQFLAETDKITSAPVIVLGAGDDDGESIERIRRMGAYEYLQERDAHERIKEIAAQISQSKAEKTEQTDSRFFADELAAEVGIVGRSESTHRTLRMIKLAASSRCNPILIAGPTGTGKELAARAVHHVRHPDKPFVAVNCAALTANLLESELFGHVRGSFTGADREKTGLLELADTGTLFLDEISEMPLDLQAKLLRVLQERTFRKVGGVEDIRSNATVVASSNRNLKEEAQSGRFRKDLYYRLNVAPITLAPLQAAPRREDITLLCEYFVLNSTICPEKTGQITSLTKLAVERLQKHDWPGNVRELRNVIERAVLYESSDKIGINSIVFDPFESTDHVSESAPTGIKDYSLAKAERELIARALGDTGWQKTRAAALLGITRATLYAKVKHYDIKQACDNDESVDSSNTSARPVSPA